MPRTLNIPCPSHSQCGESPLANLSSEAPDQEVFPSVYFPPVNPPLGRSWTGSACMVTCTSTISQEEADLCALRAAAVCDATPPPEPPPPMPICNTPGGCAFIPQPPYFPPTYPPDPPTSLPCNEPQSCCVTCPDGTEFCYTVAACTFYGQTVAVANAIAYSYACKLVAERMVCFTGSLPHTCSDEAYSGVITVVGGTAPYTWALVAGSLPTGLTLSNPSNTTALVSGTPTVPGNYNFQIRATDAQGNFQQKGFTIYVVGITTASLPSVTMNEAYSVQLTAAGGLEPYTFAITDGALPNGLTMTSAGLISGIATVEGEFVITFSVTDSS